MRELYGRVAVVTGAGSGIGRALAVALARRGCLLALGDVDPAGLAATAGTVAAVRSGSEVGDAGVMTAVLDVADADAVAAFADAVVARFGRVDVVVNNAGIALDAARVEELRLADVRTVMDVNFMGVVHGTRAFLPHLLARPEATVVNLSSSFGITAVALQSPYCASKFAVRGFTESLRMELRAFAPHVTAITVHPGGVRTPIGRNALSAGARAPDERARDLAVFEAALRTSPERAAATIVDGIRHGRERVLIGADARVGDLLARLLPVRYTGVVLRTLVRVGFVR